MRVMPDVATPVGTLLRVPMSRDDYLALGETKCDEWYLGMRVVNPPTNPHQVAAMELAWLLRSAVPPGEFVLIEAGWSTAQGVFRPDIQVIPESSIGATITLEPPLLVVEILSPSNRAADLRIKRDLYARGGLPWYWIVDLDAAELLVLRNDDGVFVDVQRIAGGQPAETVGPYPVTVDPARLTQPARPGP